MRLLSVRRAPMCIIASALQRYGYFHVSIRSTSYHAMLQAGACPRCQRREAFERRQAAITAVEVDAVPESPRESVEATS
jgi:hypothetical protein